MLETNNPLDNLMPDNLMPDALINESSLSETDDATSATSDAKLVLALDYGVKKMGMALGNTITRNARAFDILAMDNGQPDWDNLLGIIDKWKINQVIVGLPLNMDGTGSMLSKRAHKFARRLAHRMGEEHMTAEVVMVDERLTSIEARQMAWEQGWIDDERDPIDDIAACILLDSYLSAL